MATKLQLKESVARQLGKTNASVATPKRDLSIQDALMQYVNERRWKWNQASVSKLDNAALPTDFNSLFAPTAYYYESSYKVDLALVPDSELAGISTPAFSVDGGAFNTNITTACTLVYQKTPPTIAASGSDNSDVLVMPDITAVSRLAVALYWLAAERDEGNFDRFTAQYDKLLRRDVLRDQQAVGDVRPRLRRRNMGWNSVTSY